MDRSKQLTRALTAAVKGRALPANQARATVALFKWCGAISEPDAAAFLKVRGEGKTVKKVIQKTAPTPGTKVGKLLNGARVKDASERLSAKKYALKGKDGNPLMWGAKPCESASEKDHAVIGTYFKHMLKRQGVPVHLTEFERSLWAETRDRGKWVGMTPRGYWGGGDQSDYVPNLQVKALLDDTVSGGIEITPYEFDANVIVYPLLSGELFPLVDLVAVTARRIKGGTVQNPTLTWGIASGTALQPYSTSSLVLQRTVLRPAAPSHLRQPNSGGVKFPPCCFCVALSRLATARLCVT